MLDLVVLVVSRADELLWRRQNPELADSVRFVDEAGLGWNTLDGIWFTTVIATDAAFWLDRIGGTHVTDWVSLRIGYGTDHMPEYLRIAA